MVNFSCLPMAIYWQVDTTANISKQTFSILSPHPRSSTLTNLCCPMIAVFFSFSSQGSLSSSMSFSFILRRSIASSSSSRFTEECLFLLISLSHGIPVSPEMIHYHTCTYTVIMESSTRTAIILHPKHNDFTLTNGFCIHWVLTLETTYKCANVLTSLLIRTWNLTAY